MDVTANNNGGGISNLPGNAILQAALSRSRRAGQQDR
jgi:hypothetical protein